MTEEEILKFLGASKNPEDKFIFCLMLKTGVRREALCKIRTSDIEGDVVTLRAEDAKTHTEQLVAMTPEVCELYEEFLSWKERKFKDENIEYDELFISKMRRPYTGNSIWLKFKTALRNAGFSEDRISQLSPHKLRHTFVTNFLIENNGNIAQAQMAAGHSSPNTTARYNQMAQEIVLDKMRHQKRIGEVE